MRPKVGLALFALALATGTRRAEASAPLFTFVQGGCELAFDAGGTVSFDDKGRGRTCSYSLAPADAALLADFHGPEVQSALRTSSVFAGGPARLVAASHAIEWSPRAHGQASYAVRTFYVELEVQTLKARIQCEVRRRHSPA